MLARVALAQARDRRVAQIAQRGGGASPRTAAMATASRTASMTSALDRTVPALRSRPATSAR